LDAALAEETELARDELRWLVPKLKDAAAGIDLAARSSRATTTPELDSKRGEAVAHDRGFDTCHRFVHGAFGLAELALAGEKAKRKVVRDGRASLYPEGLEITQKTWSSEGDETFLFEQRLERPEVKAALALVQAVVPGVSDMVTQAIASGRKLQASVRELAVLEAGRTETAKMFMARSRGMQVLSLLRAAVNEVYPAANAMHRVMRERLIGAYLSLLERQVGDDPPAPEPDGATVDAGDGPTVIERPA